MDAKTGQWRKLLEKKWFIHNMVLQESSTDTLECQKVNKWVLDEIKPETFLETKLQNWICPTLAHGEKTGFFRKDNNAGKKEDHIWDGVTP